MTFVRRSLLTAQGTIYPFERRKSMYTNLVNVQIIISLLKQHKIRKLVLSPGNRDIPLVHSVETDPDFQCFSIVDERSAAYFALGMADASGEVVGFVCTSSTAACNYTPAIEEASRENIPLIALTADRENYYLYQFEDQKINQTDMYSPLTKCSADLPVIRNELDKWLCERKVNEALLAVNDGVPGPVQINFQVDRTDLFLTPELPVSRKMTKFSEAMFKDHIECLKEELQGKRIMVIVGENYYETAQFSIVLEKFQSHYNAVVISDHFSNVSGNFLPFAQLIETLTADDFTQYVPDVVITFGGHMWSALKYLLRNSNAQFSHWRVSSEKIVRDGFKRLTYIFDVEPVRFLEELCGHAAAENTYLERWKKRAAAIVVPDLKYSNFSVISQVMSMLPENSVVHCSILNSARLNAFSQYSAKNIKTYCNFGCDGIDGALSTFLGQTYDHRDALSVLVIGDLSFLYDVNASLEQFTSDKRILLINNHAGSEFHTSFGLKRFPQLNVHIAAGHKNDFSEIVDTERFIYLSASCQEDLEKVLPIFLGKSDKPILLEAFTDADQDGAVLNEFYSKNRVYSFKNRVKRNIKRVIKRVLKV